MNRSLWIATALAVAIVLWLGSGYWSYTADSESNTVDAPIETATNATKAAATKVQVKVVSATPLARQRQFKGEILPWRWVDLRAETVGSVTEIYVAKGDRVAAGAKLLQLDLSDRLAKREQARAELALRQANLDANRQLQQRSLLSEHQIRADRALLAAATANLQQIETEIARTTIVAPFAGRIEQRPVEQGDYLREGDTLLTLVDNSRLKLSFYVPQQQINELKMGQPVNASLISGTELSGRISYIAQRAESATRSFLVEAEVSASDPAELSTVYLNQSASIKLTLGTEKAHFLSPSLFNLATDGSLFVKAMSSDQRVVSFPITLVQSEPKGFWVTGLPEQVTLLTTGQGFVTDGERVEPAYDEPPAAPQTLAVPNNLADPINLTAPNNSDSTQSNGAEG